MWVTADLKSHTKCMLTNIQFWVKLKDGITMMLYLLCQTGITLRAIKPNQTCNLTGVHIDLQVDDRGSMGVTSSADRSIKNISCTGCSWQFQKIRTEQFGFYTDIACWPVCTLWSLSCHRKKCHALTLRIETSVRLLKVNYLMSVKDLYQTTSILCVYTVCHLSKWLMWYFSLEIAVSVKEIKDFYQHIRICMKYKKLDVEQIKFKMPLLIKQNRGTKGCGLKSVSSKCLILHAAFKVNKFK